MLDEIRLKKFPLTSRFCDHFTCFYVLRLAREPSLSNQACYKTLLILYLGLNQEKFTRLIM